MQRRIKKIFFGLLVLNLGILFAKTVLAMPFGVYEPRSLAMGGAGVAAASSVNAVFYNPAILATYKDLKEKAHNEAFSFPTLAVRASSAVETLATQNDVNYQTDITTTFQAYNDNHNAANAQAALNSINGLYSTLGEIANNVFFLDAVGSLAIGIPSKYQGGAFFVTHRGVGDGQLSVPAADLERLDYYQQALQLVAAGNETTARNNYPNAFDGSGNLINPTGNITAEANARAAVISELGVSLSKQINLFGEDFAFGLSPKMVQVTAYDYHRTITGSTQDKQGTQSEDWRLNLDFGVLKKISYDWRIGLVVKNMLERAYPTATGQEVVIKPQWRMGVAHLTPLITYTVDLDLQPNDGVYPGNAAQYILLGTELKQGMLRYRLGYRDTVAHSGPKEDGVFSGGLGINTRTVYFDLAYSQNYQQRAASLMFGFNF